MLLGAYSSPQRPWSQGLGFADLGIKALFLGSGRIDAAYPPITSRTRSATANSSPS